MPIRLVPCYFTFDGISRLDVIDYGSPGGLLVEEPYRERRPPVVKLTSGRFSSDSFWDPTLLRIKGYLPRCDPNGYPLDNVLDQLDLVGWVDINDVMREKALARKRRRNQYSWCRLPIRRIKKMDLVPGYVLLNSLPINIADAKRRYVLNPEKTAMLFRFSGDRERPVGFVRIA